MIVALAGRRIDALQASEARFPPANAGAVSNRLREVFAAHRATALVCAAACGVDLLALEVAKEMHLRRRVVLPFPRKQFRQKSVADRGGDWGERYDRVLDELERSGDVMELSAAPNETAAIRQATEVILDEAVHLGEQLRQPVLAVAVWNLKSRGTDDWTAQFIRDATRRRIEVIQISTLDPS